MINKLIPVIAVLVLFVYAFPSDAQVPDRRWIVQTSDGKLIGFTDDQDVEPPDAAFATFVIESVIRLSDPPGATGDILPLGTWDAATSTYTPPSGGGLTPAPYDPTTDSGEVKDAAHQMMDVFENALAYIEANRHVWTQDTGDRAIDGIHWMMVNSARVALNSTRTHANRQKFLEEAASWPTGVNGEARQYVDAFAANDGINPSKDWSWVDVDNAALPRLAVSSSGDGFDGATNVEDAPTSETLVGRAWIPDIP